MREPILVFQAEEEVEEEEEEEEEDIEAVLAEEFEVTTVNRNKNFDYHEVPSSNQNALAG